MTKVNFLTGGLILRGNRTGVHEYHYRLVREAVKSGRYEISVSAFGSRKNLSRFAKGEIFDGLVRYSFWFARALAYIFPIELFFGRSDVYICDGLVPLTLFRSKKVAVIHDLMVKKFKDFYSPLMRTYLNLYFWQCRRADVIIVNSESTKRDVIDILGIDEGRIYNGYAGCKYVESVRDISSKPLNNSKGPYLLYVGDMRPNKNLLNAIKGYRAALDSMPELRFIIAGSKTGQYKILAEYVSASGVDEKVEFAGYVSEEEKTALYKGAYAFLFVSLYEGFGSPIVEAGLLGTPVITSNTSSMKEIAEGVSILVDPRDTGEIAKAILSLRDERLRQKIITRQREQYSKFTWSATARNLFLAIDSFSGE